MVDGSSFETETSSNPLAPSNGGGSGDDVETAGTSAAEHLGDTDATLQQQVVGLTAAAAALKARVETLEEGGGIDAAIRSVFASIGTAPANWHQATVFFLSSEKEVDQAMRKRAPLMFVGGLLVIVFQIIVTIGVTSGSMAPACESNEQCHSLGTYCLLGGANRCTMCGDGGIYNQNPVSEYRVPCDWGSNEPRVGRTGDPNYCFPNLYRNKTAVAEVCADPQDRLAWSSIQGIVNDPVGFKARGVRAWCEACVFTDGEVNRNTGTDYAAGSIMSMGTYDWATLIFATYVVGLTIVGELKDVELCGLAIKRIPEGALDWKWVTALSFCLELRRFVFLPAMLIAVATLVMTKGGDALSVCFNTVAILFLVEIDNISYHVGLGELQKARVESAGRVVLSDVEAKNLAWLKVMYVPVSFACVITYVATIRYTIGIGGTFVMCGLVAPTVTTILWHNQREDPPPIANLLLQLAKVVGKWFFSFALYMSLFWFSFIIDRD
jgi:hypothetical protein